MTYKEIKEFQLVKGTYPKLVERFRNSVVNGVDGYLGLEAGVNTMHNDYDLLVLTFTWTNYESFIAFKNSELHMASHKHKLVNPDVIKSTKRHFQVI